MAITDQAEELCALMAHRLGQRRGPLSRRLARSRRRLPASVRSDIARIAEADAMAQNPRLAARTDPGATQAEFERARSYLAGIDIKDRRKGQILSVLGSVAFDLLVVTILVITVLRWRGLA
ncbi:hypothetical protein [Marivita sp. GX14005]|uniref:hypothetical protein n=1 Tax=Marivita sp. GX14005 TaxID=2942276 RepID=UPI00201897B9|nr:hypothetical protein [Marivita sp. GX14005]MCL3880945.1 hypothetical protein [Marivita sp. GX14005]